MGQILDFAEQLLSGALSPDAHPPFAPLLCHEALFPDLLFISSFANVTALRTAEGLLLFDAGSALLVGQVEASLRAFADAPVHTLVYTHGHVDHVGGAPALAASAHVVAHRAVPARFDRYRLTAGYNQCINTRQFRMPVRWPEAFRYPDQIYDEELVFSVGGEEVRLYHGRGETDDHTWAFWPRRKVLLTGDLFIWATPNAGNPQKVQRYPREWAQALRAMLALQPEVLCPGHGPPIVGAERVARALSETAELLESLVDQTLSLLNAGARLSEILHSVRAPQHLLDRPYLRPIYDEPAFIVRNIVRLYGGWWDGNPAHLLPAREERLAAELARLCGGAGRLAARAQELLATGEPELAGHLAELAAQAAPDDPAVWQARAAVFSRRAQEATSLMARAIFQAAADERR
jgi:alkyl sulfatase BDS1-like metallo-beta-lactamase superfamily hydrolase